LYILIDIIIKIVRTAWRSWLCASDS